MSHMSVREETAEVDNDQAAVMIYSACLLI